jgi:hypothetical protein
MVTPVASSMEPLRFKLDESIVVKAAQLNASRFTIKFIRFSLVLAVLVAAYQVFERGDWSLRAISLRLAISTAIALLLAGCFLIILRVIVCPWQARRNFRQQKQLSEDMELAWTPDELAYGGGKSRTVIPFKHLHAYQASDDLILLYLSENLYHLVPVSALATSGRREALVERLEEAGVRRF